MAVVEIDRSAPAAADVINLLNYLVHARNTATHIAEINGQMDAAQLLDIMGVDPAEITATAWANTITAIVTLLNDAAVDNYVSKLI